jgi:plastocyanin
VAIATGGNQSIGSANGDAVWAFSLKGQVHALWPPPPPPTVAGPTGPIAAGADKVEIGVNNIEYRYGPGRIRIKAGTTVTWTNGGDLPHTATDMEFKWDTGDIDPGQSKSVTFDAPGNYYYICRPHPWMYGQIIVEQ